MRKENLIGQKFGFLTVISEAESIITKNNQKKIVWHCKCDCGNEINVKASNLKSGSTKSCGCYQKESARLNRIKSNTYDLSNDYGIGYTLKGEIFYFDKEDFDKIKDFCWRLRRDGYLDAKFRDSSGKRILMHNLIMNEKYIDHIGGYNSRNDNRKSNLRKSDNVYSFETYNNMNKQVQSNNKSGCPGVTWHNRDNIWEVRISVNKKNIYLGRFKDFNEAVKVRKEAEEQYFKNWSYDNSQNITKRSV